MSSARPVEEGLEKVDFDVISPHLKWRLSGVTATLVRLLPIQAQTMKIVATGPGLPRYLPHIPLWRIVLMSGGRQRVWHARRNTEMLLGLVLRDILRKRLILVFTTASQRDHTGLSRFLISRMDEVVATSQRSASYLNRPSHVIMHGIDVDKFTPTSDKGALRQKLGLPDGCLVGCFGRIRHQKGTDIFVDAMLEVLRTHPEMRAVIMGRAVGKHQAFLQGVKQRVAAAGYKEMFLFLPEVDVDAMPEWYRALDLFVAPQRWEGFGVTPLEAMACGVPIVATRVGAFDELVVDGETGILVPPGDIGQMSDAIQRIAITSEILSGFGAQGRQHVVSQFNILQEVQALNSIYGELLSKPGDHRK